MKPFFFALGLFISTALFAQKNTIDNSNSTVGFTITNAGLEVEGFFRTVSGTINFDKNNLSATKMNANVKTESIDTDIEMRDNHLREEDYFNVEEYASMSFKSSSVSEKNGAYTVSGTLTIKDVSKTISFPFSVKEENGKEMFSGSFTIDRRDYNVGGNSWIMGDDVTVNLTIAVNE